MSELDEKVKMSIERLKAFEPEEGYYLAFSGGKDSVVCKALLDMAGVKYDATYRVTSVDPPELVRFIKEKHPDVKREVPRYDDGKPITMWNLITRKRMPPTRRVRYCCEYLKEGGGDGRKVVTGVRWAESPNRRINQGLVTVYDRTKKLMDEFGNDNGFKANNQGGIILTNDNEESRRLIEHCYKRTKVTVNPIIDWEDKDVWDFIKSNKIPYCSLYSEGFSRLGCIGCPMARTKGREQEFIRWPKYKQAYIKAFEKMLIAREAVGKDNKNWESGKDVYNWWMEYGILPGQINLFEEEN